ncbi:Protein of unknown function [Propionibacterium freudenreichii]|jgi:hypothetical protein
MSRTG